MGGSYGDCGQEAALADLARAERKERERRRVRCRVVQKVSGAILALIGVALPFVADGDITASIILVPLGVFLLFTRDMVMGFR